MSTENLPAEQKTQLPEGTVTVLFTCPDPIHWSIGDSRWLAFDLPRIPLRLHSLQCFDLRDVALGPNSLFEISNSTCWLGDRDCGQENVLGIKVHQRVINPLRKTTPHETLTKTVTPR